MWLSFCANPVRGRGQPRGTRTCNQVHRALGTPRARSGHAAPVFLVHRGLRPLKNGQNDVRAGLRPPSQVHLFAKNEGVGSQQGLAHHVAGPWAFVGLNSRAFAKRDAAFAALIALDQECFDAFPLDTFEALDGLRALPLSLRGERNREWLTDWPHRGGRGRRCLTVQLGDGIAASIGHG